MIIVVEKATSLVKDVNQQYDTRFFDHVDVPDGTIPTGENPAKFFRDANGNIVRRSLAVLLALFPDEFKADIRSRIDALPALTLPAMQAILKEIVARL